MLRSLTLALAVLSSAEAFKAPTSKLMPSSKPVVDKALQAASREGAKALRGGLAAFEAQLDALSTDAPPAAAPAAAPSASADMAELQAKRDALMAQLGQQ